MILSDDFWSLRKDVIVRAPLAEMEGGTIKTAKTKTVDFAKSLDTKIMVCNLNNTCAFSFSFKLLDKANNHKLLLCSGA